MQGSLFAGGTPAPQGLQLPLTSCTAADHDLITAVGPNASRTGMLSKNVLSVHVCITVACIRPWKLS